MKYRRLLALLTLCLLSLPSHAIKYLATFKSTVTDTTFTLNFDDSLKLQSSGYSGLSSPDDIRWHVYEDYPYFQSDDEALIGVQPSSFWAVSSHAQVGITVDMDFSGTTVHVAAFGLGRRMDAISIQNVDLTSIDTRYEGWAPKLFGLLSNQIFTASVSYGYDIYGSLAMSTDGPLTVQDVYGSGSKWFDGIPVAEVQAAMNTQYPGFNLRRVEPMRFVSLVPSVPEPGAVTFALAGLGLVGLLPNRRSKLSSTSRSDQ